MSEIGLAELISNLRDELSLAMAAGEGEELRFGVGPVELEVTVAVTREGGPSAKLKFWVVELGGEAKLTSASTQRLKLTLTPELRGGGMVRVAGAGVDGER